MDDWFNPVVLDFDRDIIYILWKNIISVLLSSPGQIENLLSDYRLLRASSFHYYQNNFKHQYNMSIFD